MGRVDLAWLEFKDRLKPINWVGSIDRNDVRAVYRALSRNKKKEDRIVAAHSMKIDLAIDKGVTDGVIGAFTDLCEDSVVELNDETKYMIRLLLPVRRELIRMQKIMSKETSKEMLQKEGATVKIFNNALNNWFGSVASHESLTVLASDEISVRAEVSHVLDMFNLQSAVRAVSKDEGKVVSLAKKKAEFAKKKEKDALDKLTSDEEKALALYNKAMSGLLRLMQLVIQKNNAKLNGIVSQLEKQRFPQDDLVTLKKILASTKARYNTSYKELQEQINAVINTGRKGVYSKAA